MELTDKQIEWLKIARSVDIAKHIFGSDKYDYKQKMQIHEKWLELHQQKRISEETIKKASDPSWWEG